MKQAMIFAAGLGTRLRPVTDTMPKALVPVGGRPLICHVIRRLQAAGYGRIVVNVHHFAHMIADYLHSNQWGTTDIAISDETDALLDTGGGIKKARPLFDPDSPVLIHNVDILSNLPLSNLDLCDGDDSLLVVSRRQTTRYLLFDNDRSLVGWTNTATGQVKSPFAWVHADPSPASRLAFAGIHVIGPSLLRLMDDWPERFSIIDFYLQACATHRIVAHADDRLRLLDVGKPETLSTAESFLKTL